MKYVKFALLALFAWLCVRFFDGKSMLEQIAQMIDHPFVLLMMTGLYLAAFCFKAEAWRQYLRKPVPFSIYLYGLFYNLFVNHVFPLKVGDAVRVGFLAKKTEMPWQEALHSVVVLRALDMLTLGLFAAIGSLWVGVEISWVLLLVGVVVGVVGLGAVTVLVRRGQFLFLQTHLRLMREALTGWRGLLVAFYTVISWLLEAFVVYGVMFALGLPLPFFKAVWVNSMTIAGQVFHFTPGGVGTYESVMSMALVTTGMGWQEAYAVALLTHGFKFLFSFAVGSWVLVAAPVRWHDLKNSLTMVLNRNRIQSVDNDSQS